ncbi:hypothetical protein BD779DRAFT_1435553 [Infundibulicybe gibba]|nr:hypothetical protein BD779DRAFT_1435553 [Infundibulicybe gibba]
MSNHTAGLQYILDGSILPVELVDSLNQTYFFHVLANNPAKVIPPGKSLLSMLGGGAYLDSTTANDQGTHQQDTPQQDTPQHQYIRQNALDVLSSSPPPVQIPRLQILCRDLLEALSPLLPPSHIVLTILSSPFPPTSSPLLSTLALLKEILAALRERCAPARDEDVDSLILTLSTPLPPPGIATNASLPLAQLVVDAIRSTINLSEKLKADLNQFFLGALTEEQLHNIVAQQAMERERRFILDVWGDSTKDGRDRINDIWQQWTHEIEDPPIGEGQWLRRLVAALGENAPVCCNLPPPFSDAHRDVSGAHAPSPQLPPQLFFVVPELVYIQNYLQALVIAASLRSLIRLPIVPQATPSNVTSDFMKRTWALLKTEIDTDDASAWVSGNSIKLINLADEIIRARRLSLDRLYSSQTSGGITTGMEEEETRLRVAVERVLDPRDPVYLLLQKRLLSAVGNMLLDLFHAQKHMKYRPKYRKLCVLGGSDRPGND